MPDNENNVNTTPEESNHDEDDRSEGAAQLRLVEDEIGADITTEQVIEAVVFSSDSPLSPTRIAAAVGSITPKQIRETVEKLNEKYEQMCCAFRIEDVGGGYQMLTRPEFAPHLQKLYKIRSEGRMSAAALETLAVVAYKQPVLRAEVEAIRGVACGEMLRSLMDRSLIRIVGRAEELGRPMLYGTTKRFLEVFGLRTLDDLPKVGELQMPKSSTDRQDDPPDAEDTSDPTDETNTDDDPPDTPATTIET